MLALSWDEEKKRKQILHHWEAVQQCLARPNWDHDPRPAMTTQPGSLLRSATVDSLVRTKRKEKKNTKFSKKGYLGAVVVVPPGCGD